MAQPQEMTLERVVELVAKDLKIDQLLNSDAGRAAVAAHINAEVRKLEEKFTSEIAEERKLRTSAEEGINELRERISRRERLDREYPMHIDRNGLVRPNVTRECADHLVSLFRGERALSGGVDAEGGYLVAPEFASEILRLVATTGLYRRVARVVPMKTDEINFGKLASGITVYWPGENASITLSEPSFGQLKLTAKILAGYTEAPETLLDDASSELGQFIADLFIEGIAKEEDRVGFVGNTGSGDAFMGILRASGTVSKVMDATKTKTSDITADNLLDLQTTVPDGAREDCRYFMSPTVFDAVRKLKDSQGNYIWQAPVAGAPGTIWGKPYELSERFPAYSTSAQVSLPFVAYGNPRNLMLGDRKQLAVRSSDVAGSTFQKIQTAIRVHERIAIGSYGEAFAKLVTAAA